MRQFLKYVLATIVGLLAFSLLGFLILAGIIGAAKSAGDRKEVASNSVLELKLSEPLTERGREGRFQPFIDTFGGLLNPPR